MKHTTYEYIQFVFFILHFLYSNHIWEQYKNKAKDMQSKQLPWLMDIHVFSNNVKFDVHV